MRFSVDRRSVLASALVSAPLALSLLAAPFAAQSAPATVGAAAPAFTAKDTAGKTMSLSDLRGKTVVLEWVNPGCPYVRKHYGANNMQATQKGAADKGVVWLAINSTATDHSDYLSADKMGSWMRDQKALANATLMDSDGKLGRAYGARTTPHMYVIDAKGRLVYAGAIDNKPTARAADIAGATNHVNLALAEVLAGKAVSVATTQAYGCSVKYSAV